ncbi:hypothetical protein J0H58_11615 [bacterium]|nr:hypothetical protein [bacterium]
MAKDWFRRTTWTPADREAFFARLRRSRTTFHKAQYLCLQAGTFLGCRTPEGTAAALELTEVLLRDYPDPFELASAHLIRAEYLESQGDVPGAVEAYRHALQAQRDHPRVRTTAPQGFAWLVATRPLPDLYREALAGLDEFGETDGSYRSRGARALIQFALGDRAAAGRSARLALEAAAGRSGLRASDRRVRERLAEVAAAEPVAPPDPATASHSEHPADPGARTCHWRPSGES